MSMKSTWEERTPCEVLREINDLVQDDDKKSRRIRKKLAYAENLVKDMALALRDCNKDALSKGTWEKNKDYEEDAKRRQSKNYRWERA